MIGSINIYWRHRRCYFVLLLWLFDCCHFMIKYLIIIIFSAIDTVLLVSSVCLFIFTTLVLLSVFNLAYIYPIFNLYLFA